MERKKQRRKGGGTGKPPDALGAVRVMYIVTNSVTPSQARYKATVGI